MMHSNVPEKVTAMHDHELHLKVVGHHHRPQQNPLDAKAAYPSPRILIQYLLLWILHQRDLSPAERVAVGRAAEDSWP